MDKTFIQDITQSLSYWRYWVSVSIVDIKNKYRTLFGPLWVTGTVAVTIFAMGPFIWNYF